MMNKIAVIFPSRGLAFSRTAEELLDNLKGYDYKIFFSHRKPLPRCFNDPLNEALKGDYTHIWIVEDDMILRPGTLKKMLKADEPIVTANYPVNENGRGAVFFDKNGEPVFCGTGCLLIKREVFDKLKEPYFTDEIGWRPYNMLNKNVKFVGVEMKGEYGTHDITFCMKARKAGYKIHCIDTKLAQRKLVALGKAGSNNGAHHITNWRKIDKYKVLEEITSYPPSITTKSKLVGVKTKSGVINATKEHADTLIEQGLGEIVKPQAVMIDYSGVDI